MVFAAHGEQTDVNLNDEADEAVRFIKCFTVKPVLIIHLDSQFT